MRNSMLKEISAIVLSVAGIFTNASCNFQPASGFGDTGGLFRPCECKCKLNEDFARALSFYTPEQVYAILISGGELCSVGPNSKPEVSYNLSK